MPPVPGTKLGPYEIQSPPGAWRHGEVSHTHDTRLDRMVALKIPTEMFSSDSDRLRGFQDEGRILGTLNHPSVLPSIRRREQRHALSGFGVSGRGRPAVRNWQRGELSRWRIVDAIEDSENNRIGLGDRT